MWRIKRDKRGRVILYFVSPTGNILKRIDVSDMTVKEFKEMIKHV